MKKIIRVLSLTAVFSLLSSTLFFSCKTEDEIQETPLVAVSSVSISGGEETASVGDEVSVTAEVFPKNASDKKVMWISSDESVASVEDGRIIFHGKGEVSIIAVAGGIHSKAFKITVNEKGSSSEESGEIEKKDDVKESSSDQKDDESKKDSEKTEDKSEEKTEEIKDAGKIEDNLSITLQSGVGGAWFHITASWKSDDWKLKYSALDLKSNIPCVDEDLMKEVIPGETGADGSSFRWAVGFSSAAFVSETEHLLTAYMTVRNVYYKVSVKFIGKASASDEDFTVNSVSFEKAQAPAQEKEKADPEIDWDSISYLDDGCTNTPNAFKYKFYAEYSDKISGINIQQPDFASQAGIYASAMGSVTDCSLSSSDISGGGLVLHLSNFKEGVTKFTITVGLEDYRCYVYFNPNGRNPELDASEERTPSGLSISKAKDDVMIAKKSGMKMVFQFQNCTNGVWNDDEIYIYVVCMNPSTKVWSYLTPEGKFVQIGTSTSESWQYTLAELKESGVQVPYAEAGRIYYSYGAPLDMKGTGDGVAFPSLSNKYDPNYYIYFDWLEFTVAENGTWVNTTQVDQLGFPVLMNLYGKTAEGKDDIVQTGLTASRSSIWAKYKSEMTSDFASLVNDYRIIAPCKGEFDDRRSGAYGDYFDDYVDEVWNYWKDHSANFKHLQGNFTLYGDGNNLYFKCTEAYGEICSAGTVYTITGKPTTSMVFEGYGVLATGNVMELALEAQVCAALNRHVATLDPDTQWVDSSLYYKEAPANFYAKFWHDVSENGGLAYGFCYDDVNDQSATSYINQADNCVVRLGF